jgi:hypothetical protein
VGGRLGGEFADTPLGKQKRQPLPVLIQFFRELQPRQAQQQMILLVQFSPPKFK